MSTSFRRIGGCVAAGRGSGWPAALAASLLIHSGLALFTAPPGLARQVSPERPLHVDWRRSPAPSVASRAPDPPPPPSRPTSPSRRRDLAAAPVAAAPAPAATLQARAPARAATPDAPPPGKTPATTGPAIIAPASEMPAPVPAAPLAEGSTEFATDRPPAAAAPLADLTARCQQRPAPIYPAAARRRGDAGRVLVSVDIDARGLVARAEVAASSGSRWLDAAALDAVRHWRCSAARQGGQAVVASALQPFSFVLHDGPP